MGRGKREQASRDGGGGAGGSDAAGAAAATPVHELSYARDDCGLCKQAIDAEGEEHITGVCTVCQKIPLHLHCATDQLGKMLRAEQKGGSGHSSKSLMSMLLVADSRPWELLAAGVGKAPKWHCLRRCIICQDGVMEIAEKVRPRKAAPAAPAAPAPRPSRAVPASKPPAAPARKAAASAPCRLVEPAPSAAARVHGSGNSLSAMGHSGSSGSVSTFAAEQERVAKEAARKEAEQRREVARARKEAQEAERLSRLSQHYEEQIAALMPEEGSDDDGSQEGSEGPGVPAWWPANSAPLPLPLPTTGSPAAVATPELTYHGGAAGSLPTIDYLAGAAEPGGVAWLPVPQFEGREEAPPEEIEDLLALMGIS